MDFKNQNRGLFKIGRNNAIFGNHKFRKVELLNFQLLNGHMLIFWFLSPPWKRGHIVLQLSVVRYVGLSVCRPCVIRLISFDPFTWSIPNLVQGLHSIRKCFLLIFRSQVQRSRSNHSFEPSVLSDQYLLTPSLIINTKLGARVATMPWTYK